MPSRMSCPDGHSTKWISAHDTGLIEMCPTIGPWRVVPFTGVSAQIERSAWSTVS